MKRLWVDSRRLCSLEILSNMAIILVSINSTHCVYSTLISIDPSSAGSCAQSTKKSKAPGFAAEFMHKWSKHFWLVLRIKKVNNIFISSNSWNKCKKHLPFAMAYELNRTEQNRTNNNGSTSFGCHIQFLPIETLSLFFPFDQQIIGIIFLFRNNTKGISKFIQIKKQQNVVWTFWIDVPSYYYLANI